MEKFSRVCNKIRDAIAPTPMHTAINANAPDYECRNDCFQGSARQPWRLHLHLRGRRRYVRETNPPFPRSPGDEWMHSIIPKLRARQRWSRVFLQNRFYSEEKKNGRSANKLHSYELATSFFFYRNAVFAESRYPRAMHEKLQFDFFVLYVTELVSLIKTMQLKRVNFSLIIFIIT